MLAFRRAAQRGASPVLLTAVRSALAVVSAALAAVLAAIALISIVMARRVVTPSARHTDTNILDLDTAAQTITLTRTPDTQLPGRYGLFTSGTESYVKLGSVLAEDHTSVKRKLLTHIGSGSQIAAEAAFSGWYFHRPEELHIPFTTELIGSTLGAYPAWLFPARPSAGLEDTDESVSSRGQTAEGKNERGSASGEVWVIQVHGRGATRGECLRAVPVFHGLGITSLVVSYRNDGEAPRSRKGTYALGATEWRDVDAAIGFARRRGARRILLMGWSMGGAITLQVELNSAHRDIIAGLILESPVVDWRVVLGFQAKLMRVPSAVTGLAMSALQSEWATGVTGTGAAISFDRLDAVARSAELQHPILILHSDDDGYVPSDASHLLEHARSDLVELQVFTVARHTKLWNYDQERWSTSIATWLKRHQIAP